MEIRFHLDESVTTAVAVGLRLRGIDVTTTNDAGLLGATDPEQLAHALAEGRVLVTHDDDFLTLHAQGAPHAGIAFAPPGRRTIGQIVLALVDLWRTRTAEEMKGVVAFI
jgi:hypothetical protein